MDGRRRIKPVGRERGVTLLELLVVMAILAFVTSIAVYNAPPPRSGAREEAQRFAARVRAAWEDSVLRGSVTSIEVSQSGYRVLRYVNGEWRAEPNARRFSERLLSQDVKMEVTLGDGAFANKEARDGDDEKNPPARIVLDPIGAETPFTVRFSDRRERWKVSSIAGEAISVVPDAR